MTINFNKAEFVLSATTQNAFIRDGRPQVTFAGRSNVGKSSVINRLLNRKNFARVGATPGKTSQVNYFRIDGSLSAAAAAFGQVEILSEDGGETAFLTDCISGAEAGKQAEGLRVLACLRVLG